MKKIEVRGRGLHGVYRLTGFRGENQAASTEKRRKELRRLAMSTAERWMRVFPDDDIRVMEEEDV